MKNLEKTTFLKIYGDFMILSYHKIYDQKISTHKMYDPLSLSLYS